MSVCPSVPSVTSCLDQSIFIILAQINKQTCLEQSIFIFLKSESNQGAIEHSENTQRALREHLKALYQSHTNRSLKYCVLLIIHRQLHILFF